MATREHADELLSGGKRKKGLAELRECVDQCRANPEGCPPVQIAGLLGHLAYEIRMDRKTGMPYYGKYKEEADALITEAQQLLEASDERPDGSAWMAWHGVARRLALMDGDPFRAVQYSHELIRRIEALPDGDTAVLDQLRELHHRDGVQHRPWIG